MPQPKKVHPKVKLKLHPRNKHRGRYDFKQLIESCSELSPFVRLNAFGDESIDFADPEAVKMLNTALLKHYYGIVWWDIPPNYLCPPIPGRADYIHHIADLLGASDNGEIPTGKTVRCLDIGVGANCVFPIIGNSEYGWSFVGSDIDPVAIESAKTIVGSNPFLKDAVEIRLQPNPKAIFQGIIQKDESFDLSVCNPPFHASLEEAESGTLRKLKNLGGAETVQPALNFGGQNGELWCEGGEQRFVRDMIHQSRQFANACFWYSTLISKQSNLKGVYETLEKAGAMEVKTLPIGQGNKKSRIVAWTFLSRKQQKAWHAGG